MIDWLGVVAFREREERKAQRGPKTELIMALIEGELAPEAVQVPDTVPLRIRAWRRCPHPSTHWRGAFRLAVKRAHPDLNAGERTDVDPGERADLVQNLIWARDFLRWRLSRRVRSCTAAMPSAVSDGGPPMARVTPSSEAPVSPREAVTRRRGGIRLGRTAEEIRRECERAPLAWCRCGFVPDLNP